MSPLSMVWIIILCIILLCVGLLCSHTNILSPAVLTPTVWLFCLLLFLVLPHNLPPLTWQFKGALMLWMVLMCLSALCVQSLRCHRYDFQPDLTIRNMYLIVTVLTLPAFAVFIAHNMEAAQGDHWALNLRTAATGGSEDDAEVYGGLNVIVWQVTYMLELFCLSRKSWWRITIPALALLAFAFFTMSKWGFLSFFFSTISVLYFKRKIGLRHILIGIVVLFGLFVIIQSLRYAVSTRQLDKSNFVVLYLLSSMSAFDTLLPASSLHWGENTFRAFYSLCNQLGLSPIKPPTGILPFIEKPIETNTYTCMYPFFKDFGYWGVALFATIMGALSGFIFKRAQRGSGFYILLYAVCVNCLIMQYANEMLMTSLFAYIKEWLLLLLPFIATKYHIFSHKTV